MNDFDDIVDGLLIKFVDGIVAPLIPVHYWGLVGGALFAYALDPEQLNPYLVQVFNHINTVMCIKYIYNKQLCNSLLA